MKIKLSKVLNFINKSNTDDEKTINLNINIICDFQDDKIFKQIDEQLSKIQFNNFQTKDDYKKEQINIKEQIKQQEKFKKEQERKHKLIIKNKIKEQEKIKREQEKLSKKYE
jgi:Ni,Fe-hydrogenase I large subunit